MAHEILSIKLSEMDDQIARMHSRIQMSEVLKPDQIHGEVQNLIKECQEKGILFRKSLEHSRSKEAAVLLNAYDSVEQTMQFAFDSIQKGSKNKKSEEEGIEERLLLAEYGLDYVMLIANRVLVASMAAIEEQLKFQTKETDII